MRRSFAVLLVAAVAAPAAFALTPGDERIAYRALVKLTDLPEGWRTAPTDKSSSKKCVDPDKIATPTGKARRDFAKGEAAELFSLVLLYKNTAQTQRVFSAVANEKTWDCFSDELKSETHAKDVKQGRYLLRGIQAQIVAREILATYEANGIDATAYVHVDLVKKGRAIIYLVHLDAFSPALTLSEEASVIRRMLVRLPTPQRTR
jgi:hypothetical protein